MKTFLIKPFYIVYVKDDVGDIWYLRRDYSWFKVVLRLLRETTSNEDFAMTEEELCGLRKLMTDEWWSGRPHLVRITVHYAYVTQTQHSLSHDDFRRIDLLEDSK